MASEEQIGHGAEARVFLGSFCGKPCVIKERVPKAYRHPALEESLSKRRLNQEARCLLRSRKSGVAAPCVYHIDYDRMRMYMAKVDGETLKAWLLSLPSEANIKTAMVDVGKSLGQLHDADVIHGDLTSSNIMLSATMAPSLIDFGLSYVSSMAEDKAVDLYVLERALESTHTQEKLMEAVLEGYKQSSRKQDTTLTKLADVRMRGRKRVMVG